MANQPYLHIGIADNVVCRGVFCHIKDGCARHESYKVGDSWHTFIEGEGLVNLDVTYLSGIPTAGDRGCHFKEGG